jgi:hypothetical protein
MSRFQGGSLYIQMACETGARSEGFTELGSLVTYSILLSTLCPNKVSVVSEPGHFSHPCKTWCSDDDDDDDNDIINNSDDDDDGGGSSISLCNIFAVIDTVTQHLLQMYLAHVSLSSIVYIGSRKRVEWRKTIQFLEVTRDFASTS